MVLTPSILFFSAFLAATVSATSHHGAPSDRVLRAATKRSDLSRRSMRIEQKYNAELSYVEVENGWASSEVFASQVKVGSDSPILNLEDIEHHLQSVQCEKETIKLRFVDVVSKRDAMHACHGGTIITSHESCNIEGERAVYKVGDVEFPEDEFSLELSVVRTTWKEVYTRFDIDFGYTTDNHLFRRHSDFSKLRRRQEPSGTTPSAAIPTNAPEEQQRSTFDLTSEITDVTFGPENITNFVDIDGLQNFPVLGCKKCTTAGTLVISQGNIKIDVSQADTIPDALEGGDDGKDLFSVITDGFIQLTANDVAVHAEIFAKPSVSGQFEVPLPPIPLTPFTILGVGMAGAQFAPAIQLGYEIDGEVEINYGFDLTVPNDSKVRVDLKNFGGSTVTGFPDAKIQSLPVSVNVADVELKVGAALRPSVEIGFKFLDQFEATVNVFIDLPRLDAHLTTRDVDTKCKALPPIELAGDAELFGPLLLVEANVSINVGVGAKLELPLAPAPINEIETEINIFKTTYPIATSCVAAGKDGPKVTATATSTTPAPTGNNPEGAEPTGVEEGTSTKDTCVPSTTTVYVTAKPTLEPSYPVPGGNDTAPSSTGYVVPPPPSPAPSQPLESENGASGAYSLHVTLAGLSAIAGMMAML